MNFFTNKKIVQKIVIAILVVILTSFCIPSTSQADTGGKLMSPILQFVVSLFDGVQHLLEKTMLGESADFMQELARNYKVGSTSDDDSDDSTASSVINTSGPIVTTNEFIDATFFGLNAVNVPHITYTPEIIFSNQVPALDVNFINPSITTGNSETDSEKNSAVILRPIIASWYVAIRYIAIIGLLSVLVYIGIRMLLSSVAADRAKYKQMLFDWIVAICLVFILHYIMSFTMTLSETITSMISPNVDGTFTVYATKIDGLGLSTYSIAFSSNLMSYVRFMVQAGDLKTKIGFVALYIMLVIYSIRFTWVYLKRVVNMAFLTLMAPLVALTYPIDKVGDGKAQAFSMWLKEYIYNALIQPVDLLLYSVLLGSAVQLAADNPIYAIVALGFIIAAEKLVKQMFGFNKASGGTVGSLAAAAGVTSLASNALNTFAKKGPGAGPGPQNGKVRTKDIPERQGKDNGANSPFAAFNGRSADEVLGGSVPANGNTSPDGNIPSPDSNIPSPDSNIPSPDSNIPSPDGNTPSPDSNTPSPDGNTPSPDGNTPSPDGDIPSPDGDIPSPDGDIPSPDGDIPSPDGDIPSPDGDIPSPDEYLDNVGNNNPSGETESPDFFSTVRNDWSNWKARRSDDIEEMKDKYYMTDEVKQTQKSSKELRKKRIKDGINKKAIAAWKAAPTVAYSAARGTLKTASKIATAGTMGALGLAIGATTGDGEKAVSMAMGAAGLGLTTGGNVFESAAKNRMPQKSISGAYNAAKYGSKQAARDAKADKEYFKSEKFDDFYDQYYKGKKDMDGNQYTKKKLQEITQSYRSAGITSEKDIRKALKLEEQYRKANSNLSAQDARAEVQNIVQGYNGMDAQDKRAFTNKEAKENVISNLSGLVGGKTPQDSRKIAEQIFQGYVDFRNI
jgi:hypothetical protein